jgi:hypothetical protein
MKALVSECTGFQIPCTVSGCLWCNLVHVAAVAVPLRLRENKVYKTYSANVKDLQKWRI